MYGSYNTLDSEIGNSVRRGKFSSHVSLNYNRTDGHRENSEFEQYGGYAKVGYDFTRHWKAYADANVTHFNAMNPGTVSVPMLENKARITRGVVSAAVENHYQRSSGAVKLYYNFGKHRINDGHAVGENPAAYLFRSKDQMAGITAYQSYSFFTGNVVTLGFDYAHYGGEVWHLYPDHRDDQLDKTLYDVAGYLNFRHTLAERLTLNAGIRLDYNEWTGSEWVPQAGLSYVTRNNTVWKVNVAKGFRNPTIRDMFLFPPQNPDLEPEKLWSYELSVSQSFIRNKLNVGLNLFYIDGDNAIETLFVDGGPLNMNTGEIENWGLEVTANYRICENITVSANYSWLHMVNKVLAAPEHKLFISAHWSKNIWTVSTGIQYVKGLYTRLYSVAGNGTVIPQARESFVLWNLRASARISPWADVFVKGENLLAQKYEINIGYPMPRATVFAGFQFRF